MTNVITIDSRFLVDRLNSLPPASRKRAGYCDLIREVRRMELMEPKLSAELVGELERVFEADELVRLREVW
jgi:hypothetical protein